MVSAFSVPKTKREEKIIQRPGPGQYNPQVSPKIVKPSDPKFSFGKQARQQKFSNVPGPGSYQGKADFVKDKNPSYSLGGRKQNSPEKYNVGPGQYQPSIKYSKDKSPSYSLYGRDAPQLKGNKVGPGQYQLKAQLQVKKSGYQFSKERRDHLQNRKVPGPGSYQYQKANFKYGSKVQPSYGFGSRLKQQTTLNVPGPGNYESNNKIYSKIGGIMSRQMRNSYVESKTPGPGNYQHDIFTKVKNHEPSWSLSKSSRNQMSKSIAIGPGAYDYDKNYKSLVTTNKGYNFGSQKKLRYDPGAVPGPGTYTGENIKSKKGIRIAEKVNQMSKSQVPGPGSYENEKYDHTSWMKGGQKYTLGKGSRDDFATSKVPGPGSYQSPNKDAFRGKVTFSRENKLKQQKSLNPGPGQYSLKPTFADVPKYLLSGKQ